MTFFILLVTGVLLSLPIGPMGAAGAMQLANGRKPSAMFLALGVCMGDGVLTAVALWGVTLPDHVLKPLSFFILLGLAVYMLRRSSGEVAFSFGKANFPVGFMLTAFHPGNFFAFTLAFKFWHDQDFALESLTVKVLLVIGVTLCALAMWGLFLTRATRGERAHKIQQRQLHISRFVAAACVCLAMKEAYGMDLAFLSTVF